MLMPTRHYMCATPAIPAIYQTHQNLTLLPTILPPRTTSGEDLAAVRPSVEHDEAVASI